MDANGMTNYALGHMNPAHIAGVWRQVSTLIEDVFASNYNVPVSDTPVKNNSCVQSKSPPISKCSRSTPIHDYNMYMSTYQVAHCNNIKAAPERLVQKVKTHGAQTQNPNGYQANFNSGSPVFNGCAQGMQSGADRPRLKSVNQSHPFKLFSKPVYHTSGFVSESMDNYSSILKESISAELLLKRLASYRKHKNFTKSSYHTKGMKSLRDARNKMKEKMKIDQSQQTYTRMKPQKEFFSYHNEVRLKKRCSKRRIGVNERLSLSYDYLKACRNHGLDIRYIVDLKNTLRELVADSVNCNNPVPCCSLRERYNAHRRTNHGEREGITTFQPCSSLRERYIAHRRTHHGETKMTYNPTMIPTCRRCRQPVCECKIKYPNRAQMNSTNLYNDQKFIKNKIKEWLSNVYKDSIEFDTSKIVEDLAGLLPAAKNDDDAKIIIENYVNTLPLWHRGSKPEQDVHKSKIVNDLLDMINPYAEIKKGQAKADPVEKVVKTILNSIPGFSPTRDKHIFDDLINNINNLKSQGLSDEQIEAKMIDKVQNAINKIIEESGESMDEKTKSELTKTLVHQLADQHNVLPPDHIKERRNSYVNKVKNKLSDWIKQLPVAISSKVDEPLEKSMIDDIAKDMLARQKYLQLNPEAKRSEAEEADLIKYQVFERLNKVLDENDLGAIMHEIDNLADLLKDIPVSRIIEEPKEVARGTKSKLDQSNKKEDQIGAPITKWIEKSPLPSMKKKEDQIGAPITKWIEKSPLPSMKTKENIESIPQLSKKLKNILDSNDNEKIAKDKMRSEIQDWLGKNCEMQNCEIEEFAEKLLEELNLLLRKYFDGSKPNSISPSTFNSEEEETLRDFADDLLDEFGIWSKDKNAIKEVLLDHGLRGENKNKTKDLINSILKNFPEDVTENLIERFDDFVNQMSLSSDILMTNPGNRRNTLQSEDAKRFFRGIDSRSRNEAPSTSTPRSSIKQSRFSFLPDHIEKRRNSYVNKVKNTVGDWIKKNLDALSSKVDERFKISMIDNIAEEMLARQKYLQLNPKAKISEAEEADLIKYQVLRRLNKVLDENDLGVIMNEIENLSDLLKDIPVPSLIEVPKEDDHNSQISEERAREMLYSIFDKWYDGLRLNIAKKRNEKIPDHAHRLHELQKEKENTPESTKTVKDKMRNDIKKNFKNLPAETLLDRRASLLASELIDTIKKNETDTRSQTEVKSYPQKTGQMSKEDDRASQISEERAMEMLYSVFDKWYDSLPLNIGKKKREKIELVKEKFSTKLPELFYESELNEKALNDILPEDVDKLLKKLLLYNNGDHDSMKKDLTNLLKKIQSEKKFKKKLSETIDRYMEKSIGPIDNIPNTRRALNVLKDELVDAFKDYNYTPGDSDSKEQYKSKINDAVNKFCNNFLNKDRRKYVDTKKLKKDLLEALRKVSTPEEAEIKEVELGKKINDWLENADLDKSDDRLQNKMIPDLAHLLHELQKEIENTPESTKIFEDKMRNAIKKVLKNLPTETLPDRRASLLANKLIDTITKNEKDTGSQTEVKSYPPKPGQISKEDDRDSQISEEKTREMLFSVFDKWYDSLLLNIGEKRSDEIKEQFIKKLPELFYESELNEKALNDILPEDVDKLLKILLLINNGDYDSMKKDLTNMLKKMQSEKNNKKTLSRTIDRSMEKSTGPIDNIPNTRRAFNVYKDELVDAFKDLHYTPGDSDSKEQYKSKINDAVNKFCNNFLNKDSRKNVDTEKLKKDLFEALRRVSTPEEAEIKEVKLGKYINDWLKNADLDKCDDRLQNDMIPDLAHRLQKLQKEVENTPESTKIFEDKMRNAIKTFLKNMPTETLPDRRASLLANELIATIKKNDTNTGSQTEVKTYPPKTGQMSKEDDRDSQISEERAREMLYSIFDKWYDSLPLNIGEKRSEKINEQVLKKNPELFYESELNEKALNDILPEDVDKLLKILLLNNNGDYDSMKKVLTNMLKKMQSEKKFKKKLSETIDRYMEKSIGSIDNIPNTGRAFNVLKDELVDAFKDLHYTPGYSDTKEQYKSKMQEAVNKFCNNFLNKDSRKNVDTEKLKMDLFEALRRVSTPEEAEIKEVKLGKYINDWLENADLDKCDDRLQNEMIPDLAHRLHELQKEVENTPESTKIFEDKMRNAIKTFLKNMPTEKLLDRRASLLANELIDTIKKNDKLKKDRSSSLPGKPLGDDYTNCLQKICKISMHPTKKDASVNPSPTDTGSQTEVKSYPAKPGEMSPHIIVKEYYWDSAQNVHLTSNAADPGTEFKEIHSFHRDASVIRFPSPQSCRNQNDPDKPGSTNARPCRQSTNRRFAVNRRACIDSETFDEAGQDATSCTSPGMTCRSRVISPRPCFSRPTSSGNKPTSPGIQPTCPGKQPTYPDKQPTYPDKQPTCPSKQPTCPSKQPICPGKQSICPGTKPTCPGTKPTCSSINSRHLRCMGEMYESGGSSEREQFCHYPNEDLRHPSPCRPSKKNIESVTLGCDWCRNKRNMPRHRSPCHMDMSPWDRGRVWNAPCSTPRPCSRYGGCPHPSHLYFR